MKFCLLDRIVLLEEGRRIVALKNCSLAEEYLADHFPTFPVLPGVLMLEGLVEAGGWLVQATKDFQYGRVLLKEARAVRYGRFVTPGSVLRLEVEAVEIGEEGSRMRGVGLVDGEQALSARLVLEHRPLTLPDGCGGLNPEEVQRLLRRRFAVLTAGLEETRKENPS